jgi:prepilin-type N-terminal cleavage/methylation domain-containing protein
MSRRNRRGMTLLEIVVALALAFVVVSLGARLLNQVDDAAGRMLLATNASAREANGARLLGELLWQAESSTDSTRRFRGEARSLECWTWCLTSRGFATRCSVLLSIDSLPDSSVVWAQVNAGDSYVVRRQLGAAQFRYIDVSPSDSGWPARWQTNTSLPLAVALVTATDTTIYPVGPSRD